MANFVTGTSAQTPSCLSVGSSLLALLLSIGDALNNIDSRLKAYGILFSLLQTPDKGLAEMLDMLNYAVADTLEEVQATPGRLRDHLEAMNSKGGAA